LIIWFYRDAQYCPNFGDSPTGERSGLLSELGDTLPCHGSGVIELRRLGTNVEVQMCQLLNERIYPIERVTAQGGRADHGRLYLRQ
jgi:hypothetical protein